MSLSVSDLLSETASFYPCLKDASVNIEAYFEDQDKPVNGKIGRAHV